MQSNVHWSHGPARLLISLATVLAIVMSIFVLLASVMRYLLGSPFHFTEELVGLLFLAMTFVGMPVCTLRRSHICVTIFPDMMPPHLRRIVDRLAYTLIAVFCLWFGKLTWEYLQLTLALNARSEGSRLILWPWVALMPISCGLSFIAAATYAIFPPATALPTESQRGTS